MEFITNPDEIEKKSFEIITRQLGDQPLGDNVAVIKRVIHTTADFDYCENLVFSPDVFERTVALLQQGVNIVTDTQMARAGINKRVLEKMNGSAHCFVDSPEVAQIAKERGVTRSATAMEYAVRALSGPIIFAIGNAPTALIKLHELIERGVCMPALVIGVPVGFVNVVESKELIMTLDVPYIVAKGRKGGSNVAAAIVNAMIYEAAKRNEESEK